ncbi:MAG: hypothetical protein IPK58_17995 [Acidobacteria bacterium]|nr:hypothetical protein [Acidobacteriota bacterium]
MQMRRFSNRAIQIELRFENDDKATVSRGIPNIVTEKEVTERTISSDGRRMTVYVQLSMGRDGIGQGTIGTLTLTAQASYVDQYDSRTNKVLTPKKASRDVRITLKNRFVLPLFLLTLWVNSVVGQTPSQDDSLYRLPKPYCTSLAVIQNRSPLQFEAVDVLLEPSGRWPFLDWKLRNNSAKTVRRFVVVFKIRTNVDRWKEVGRGPAEYDIGVGEKIDIIPPNAIYSEARYKPATTMPQGVRELLAVDKEPDTKFIVVFAMIRKVVFSDGSVYEEDDDVFRNFW